MTIARSVTAMTVLLIGAAAVAACDQQNVRQRVLTTLFQGVPAPGAMPHETPFKREPRRPPLVKHEPPKPAVVKASLPEPDSGPGIRRWEDAAGKLPKDAAGNIDWVRALEDKMIEPRPGLTPEAKDQDVLPLDVELTPKDQPQFKVTFSHQAHTAWLACENCHTAIFQMEGGADPITMGKIFAGEYCGRCHGKVAFAPATGCPRCHRALAPPEVPAAPAKAPRPKAAPAVEKLKTWEEIEKTLPKAEDGSVDWVKALTDGAIAPRAALDPNAAGPPSVDFKIELVPEGQDMFKVVFPHQPHTQILGCANCHTAIFQMKRGADPITMDKVFAGEYCGRCHGKVAFAPATGCPRCHPAMAGGG